MVDSVGLSTNQALAVQLVRHAIQTDQRAVSAVATQSQGSGHGNSAPQPAPNHNAGLNGEKPNDPDAPRGTYLDISV